jgi:hypothetical protein
MDNSLDHERTRTSRWWKIAWGLPGSTPKPSFVICFGVRPGSRGFTDWASLVPDWLGATFLFYDENARLVRDCLEPAALHYTYQDVGLP